MLTAIQEGDEVFLTAIEIASAEERDAYLAQACGSDTALLRQIRERIAEHFHTNNGSNNEDIEVAAAVPCGNKLDEASVPEASSGNDSAPKELPSEKSGRTAPSLWLKAAKALLLMSAVIGIVLAVWANQTEKQARKTLQRAVEDRESALKTVAQEKLRREEAESARKSTGEERVQAFLRKKMAKDSTEDMRAVLAFFRKRASSGSRPVGWSGGPGKDVPLRKVVDVVSSKITAEFADRPIAEASIREMLGLTYLDLEEPALAVKEYERAFALREASPGEESPDTVSCRNQLAVAYRLAGRPNEASRLYEARKNSRINPAFTSK